MAGAREHIDGCDLLQRISELGEKQKIARERGRIAGDVDDALRLHGADGVDRSIVHALARRIDDDHVRAKTAPFKLPRGLSRVCAEEFHVFNAVCRGVFPRVLHSLRHDLRADHVPELPREAQADRSRSAIEIKGKFAVLRVFQRAAVELFRLRGVDLKESLRG